MDIQKEREAFENHLKKMGKTDDETFSKDEDDSYQMDIVHFGWKIWQAAKAQAVPEVINIGNELQSWVAVHSFAAKDGNDIVCAVDANALAEEIEKLTGANA